MDVYQNIPHSHRQFYKACFALGMELRSTLNYQVLHIIRSPNIGNLKTQGMYSLHLRIFHTKVA